MRTCGRCKVEKSLDDFHVLGAKYVQSYCKTCKNEYRRARRAERGPLPKKVRPRQPRSAIMLKHSHRITPEERRFMWIVQGGRCAVCATAAPSDSMHVDHDHEAACGCPQKRSCDTCRRGLLCGTCNRMLGMAYDNAHTLRAGAAYLERYA